MRGEKEGRKERRKEGETNHIKTGFNQIETAHLIFQ